jgi:hypothetical protein
MIKRLLDQDALARIDPPESLWPQRMGYVGSGISKDVVVASRRILFPSTTWRAVTKIPSPTWKADATASSPPGVSTAT